MVTPQSSSPPKPPPTASNIEKSATQPTFTTLPQVYVASGNGAARAVDKKLETAQHFEFLDGEKYIEKYSKYESDYTRRLMAKYFSEKNLYGGNIFEEKMTIDDEAISSSRGDEWGKMATKKREENNENLPMFAKVSYAFPVEDRATADHHSLQGEV